MGLYVNPPNMSKEQWLALNAVTSSEVAPAKHYNGHLVAVCLVDNGMFTAAAIAYSAEELQVFNYPGDPRPKMWFQVPVKKIETLHGDAKEWLVE
jgi:hypothetical protein